MSIDAESLWNKGKALVDRALQARDAERGDDFLLWAALSLEILGKSQLASVHPALVVDPNHADSLLLACGIAVTCEPKTIGASTVFKRCQKTVTGFDKTCLDFAVGLSEDRNAELHSGAVPFADRDLEAWLNKYWTVVDLLVRAQGRSLDDLVGASEAAAARKVIADAKNTLLVSIERRIERFRKLFAERPNEERNIRAAASKLLESTLEREQDSGDAALACPACSNSGRLSGDLIHEEPREKVSGALDDEPSWLRWVDCTFATEEFKCPACGLALVGADELDAGGIADTYEKSLIREWDEGEPYGND